MILTGLITKVQEKVSKNNSDYLLVTLKTKDKEINFYVWKDVDFNKTFLVKGNVYDIMLKEGEYPEFISAEISLLPVTEFISYSFSSIEEAKDILNSMLSEITLPEFVELNKKIFTGEMVEKFITLPAAIKHHHNIRGGLLKHTSEVFYFVKMVGSTLNYDLDYQVLLEGALLHDIGKVWNYSIDDSGVIEVLPKQLEADHLAFGPEYIQSLVNGFDNPKIEHVKHIIRSHHGPTSIGWGSCVSPATREANLVFLADYWSMIMDNFSGLIKDDLGFLSKPNLKNKYLSF